jgi:ADP-ribose pyrophosphatase
VTAVPPGASNTSSAGAGGAFDEPAFEALGERTLHRGKVLHLVEARFRGPAGEEFSRDVVRSMGAVAVIPVDETPRGPEAVVLRQYRPALGAWLTEIPAGLRDISGEAPDATAARELAEEAGLAAKHYELLIVFENAAGMTDQRTHLYLATGLSEVPVAREGVEESYLEVARLALADVPSLIASGEITDAKTVIGLLLAGQRFAT